MKEEIRIRSAGERDTGLILDFIRELAAYEKLSDEVVAREEDLYESLFGPAPAAEVILAEIGKKPVGFALFFTSFSTFLGRPGIWLEDLFVLPEFRGRGAGRLLLGHLAGLVIQRGWGRLEWSVLDWNEDAIEFYRNLGAEARDQWTTWRMTGVELRQLARSKIRTETDPGP